MHLQQLLFCFFSNFVDCTLLYFVFDIYIICFLCSNKTWLSERFSLLSRHELLLLEHFLFHFNVFIFLYDFIPILILIIIIIIIVFIISFVIINFVIVIAITFSFSMLFNFYYSSFYHSVIYLCIYRIFLIFKHMTWPNVVQNWQ